MLPITPLRALVVEDEWPARNYLVELLEASGLAKLAGAVGRVDEAMQALESETPGIGIDVVFADIALEGGSADQSGLTLARAVAGAPGAPRFGCPPAYARDPRAGCGCGLCSIV